MSPSHHCLGKRVADADVREPARNAVCKDPPLILPTALRSPLPNFNLCKYIPAMEVLDQEAYDVLLRKGAASEVIRDASRDHLPFDDRDRDAPL